MAFRQNCARWSIPKISDVVTELNKMGPGTLLAKIDIKSAYRIIPVHPADRHLLGMSWKGGIYVDTALPFGLRSAPKNFRRYSGHVGVDTTAAWGFIIVALLR